MPSRSRSSASNISMPLAQFLSPQIGAGLGRTIAGLWDLTEMINVSEPLVSVTAGLVTPVREGWTCWPGCVQEEQGPVVQNNMTKVTVAPGEALGDLVSLEAQPGEPTAGQGRWSRSLQPGRLRGTRRGEGESSWDERAESAHARAARRSAACLPWLSRPDCSL